MKSIIGASSRGRWLPPAAIALLLASALAGRAAASERLALEQQLFEEPSAELASAARELGDAGRGAVLYHQPQMLCIQCHEPNEDGRRLGPVLTDVSGDVTDEQLVQSLLSPSQRIRPGFETVVLLLEDGRVISGLVLEERPDAVVVADAERQFEEVTVRAEEIDERVVQSVSLMPTGLANQLRSRQEFLDLVRYLIELRDGGQQAAAALRPPDDLLAPPPLPDYEHRLDHAGLIRSWGHESWERGRIVYERMCANCHGTHDWAGTLPTSPRFASAEFKNGSDPWRMYQTLTHGYGLMAPQHWLVPRQKYDVIHYIRESYLRQHNPSQFAEFDDDYLRELPAGDTFGPEPTTIEPWVVMDYGPTFIHTYEVGDDGSNFAYKGIAVRLDPGPGGVSRGRHWMIFDHDTMRMAAAWSGEGFIDWRSIQFDGRHEAHPRLVGRVWVENPTGPGWADPADGRFDDRRLVGRDGRRYGGLPHEWARYHGLYHYENRAIISYRVGTTSVLEMPGVAERPGLAAPLLLRTLNLGPRDRELVLQVGHHPSGQAQLVHWQQGDQLAAALLDHSTDGPSEVAEEESGSGQPWRRPADGEPLAAGLSPAPPGARFEASPEGDLRLRIPAGPEPLRFTLWMASLVAGDPAAPLGPLAVGDEPARAARWLESFVTRAEPPGNAVDLEPLLGGGPPRWPQRLATMPLVASDSRALVADVLTHPEDNPWRCQLRFTGLDFFDDGQRMAVASWDGDVWLVHGIDRLDGPLSWQRIASGLFQPLGLRIVDETIYVLCRDQLVRLHDLNGNGEIDFYECFNADQQVTEHYHEFAMGLQTDDEGNFYYARSARHALPALVPHHGTLLRVRADGSRTDILARGFRAVNGVCLNADGTFFLTDQEGHWIPKNRINLVRPNGFYGNMMAYHDVDDESDEAMEPPVAWITNDFDRSPAELIWVDSAAWGPLHGGLLNLSYGYGKLFLVLHERISGQQMQGGMVELPVGPLPTGVMRGRFHPGNGQLYACGMTAWASSQPRPGGLYRLRYTGQELHVPLDLRARLGGLEIIFSDPLGAQAAADPENYEVRSWSLRRSAQYGSDHHDERPLNVAAVELSEDGRSVFLSIPDIEPTWSMSIEYQVRSTDGRPVRGLIHNTIHELME